MTVRFLADESLRSSIVRGLRLREPSIDLLDAKSPELTGTKDPALLDLAAEQDRILVSTDRNTMIGYFWERIAAGKTSPGLFIVSGEEASIGITIEYLLLT